MYIKARFILYTQTLDTDDFTRVAGVDPDHAVSPRVVRIEQATQRRWGLWDIRSRLRESEMPDKHMKDLCSRLQENKAGLLRARELADSCEVMCALHYEDENGGVPGIGLDEDQIALLAELRAFFTVEISIREAEGRHDND